MFWGAGFFYCTLGKHKISARKQSLRSGNFEVPSIRKTITFAKGQANASFSKDYDKSVNTGSVYKWLDQATL